MATVVQAWVNEKEEWRVYFNTELLAAFDTEHGAQKYANYLNENY